LCKVVAFHLSLGVPGCDNGLIGPRASPAHSCAAAAFPPASDRLAPVEDEPHHVILLVAAFQEHEIAGPQFRAQIFGRVLEDGKGQ
jgi:hypothetical protein